jgi:hypothetical protein
MPLIYNPSCPRPVIENLQNGSNCLKSQGRPTGAGRGRYSARILKHRTATVSFAGPPITFRPEVPKSRRDSSSLAPWRLTQIWTSIRGPISRVCMFLRERMAGVEFSCNCTYTTTEDAYDSSAADTRLSLFQNPAWPRASQHLPGGRIKARDLSKS